MKLSYNGYEHDDNENWFSVRISQGLDAYGRTRLSKIRYIIQGVKMGDDPADITSKLASMEAAYDTPGGDLIFYDNNGAETAHKLLNSQCLGGTRIESYDYLDGLPGVWGSGTEYVKGRTYRIVVAGDVHIRGGLLGWNENYQYFGTGSREYKWIESLLGEPQRQILKQRTTGIGIQTGVSVGDENYWPVPAPIYPDLLMNIKGQSPSIKLSTPNFFWDMKTQAFRTQWTYIFEGPDILPAVPTFSP